MHTSNSSIPNKFTETLGCRYPIIMAPMFLVSNEKMMVEGMRNGLAAAFPTLNYRTKDELGKMLDACNDFYHSAENQGGTYGVNLIVQKTNIWFEEHFNLCIEKKVPFYITSLGNPKEVIRRAHEYGAKVFCDVTNMAHAEKVIAQGCDGLIAVGQGAGGHAGPNALTVMIPTLKEKYPDLLIIGAGGIATGAGLAAVMVLGGDAVSVGTRFIAATEAPVSDEYKQAICDYGMEDIVMSDKISGTMATVILTPYVKKIGIRQNWLERWLGKNKRTKKFFKGIVQLRGMKALEKAAFSATYKTVWSAGQTVQLIDDVVPTAQIVANFVAEYEEALNKAPKAVTTQMTAAAQ